MVICRLLRLLCPLGEISESSLPKGKPKMKRIWPGETGKRGVWNRTPENGGVSYVPPGQKKMTFWVLKK
jgi:hypothetical protein